MALDNVTPGIRWAITQNSDGQPQLSTIPMPVLEPGTVLVKTRVVALNPSDYKMGRAFPAPGAVVGCNFAGTIIAIDDSTETDLFVGDAVCGTLPGSNPGSPADGAFATYLRVPIMQLIRLDEDSDDMMERAATVGTALATCTLCFWAEKDALNLPATPDQLAETPFPVLVYGGSTATGTIAIQLLRLSGLDPVATCSPRNFDLVRSRGASAVFDYADPHTPAAIKEYTGNRLKYVTFCYSAMARVGGRHTTLELIPEEVLGKRRSIKTSFVMAYEVDGNGIRLPGRYGKPPDPTKAVKLRALFDTCQGLINSGTLRTHPTRRMKDGFEGVLDGLVLLRSGAVSGIKLVAFLPD
ncbi:putative zinc-binding dehydrogenase family oxidoreductase [Xylaria sp. FL0043]|nr:putative zinc-binding dehydrogenase family oxidoreductase [Xylaria sp. FL0043]